MVDYDKLLQDLQDEWQVSGLGPDDMYGQYAIEIAKRANSAILAERDALNGERDDLLAQMRNIQLVLITQQQYYSFQDVNSKAEKIAAKAIAKYEVKNDG